MRRLWLIPIGLLVLLVPAAVLAGSGGEGGFDGVVRLIESRYGARATRIPFLGLISLIARKSTHEGVSNLHVAEFDDFHATVDGDELNRMVLEKIGPGWERIVRETGRDGEQTLIFMRPEGQRMGLFVVDAEEHEMDVVEVSVDPKYLSESVDRYGHRPDGGGTSKPDSGGEGQSD